MLLNGWLAEFPAILDSFLLATSIPQALLKGWRGAMKRHANLLCKVKTAKWHQLVLFTAPHNTQNSYVNPCPTAPVSRVVIYSWLAACPVEMKLFKDHLSIHGRLTRQRNKPQQKQPRHLSVLIPA